MTALLRYQAATLLRSYRWVFPLIAYALLVAAGGAGSTSLSQTLDWSGAMLVPVVAFLTRGMLTASPDAARACVSAAAGPVRTHLATLLAPLGAGVVFGLAGAAVGVLIAEPASGAGGGGVIGKVTSDVERFNFNTAIAAIMELTNTVQAYIKLPLELRDAELCQRAAETLALLLSPMAPHIAEELWCEVLGKDEQGSVHKQPWPEFDPAQALTEMIDLAVQVNGKVKAHITVPLDTPEEELKAEACAAVASLTAGKEPKKIIVVGGKLINIVV